MTDRRDHHVVGNHIDTNHLTSGIFLLSFIKLNKNSFGDYVFGIINTTELMFYGLFDICVFNTVDSC